MFTDAMDDAAHAEAQQRPFTLCHTPSVPFTVQSLRLGCDVQVHTTPVCSSNQRLHRFSHHIVPYCQINQCAFHPVRSLQRSLGPPTVGLRRNICDRAFAVERPVVAWARDALAAANALDLARAQGRRPVCARIVHCHERASVAAPEHVAAAVNYLHVGPEQCAHSHTDTVAHVVAQLGCGLGCGLGTRINTCRAHFGGTCSGFSMAL